jgi:putative transposase
MDEVFIRIQGVQHYLWHAVDQDGVVLDILVQERRNAKPANRPTRRRERRMQRFKSPKQVPGFLFAHSFIHGHFRPRRHWLAASVCRVSVGFPRVHQI